VANPPRVLHVIDSLRLGGAEALLGALVRELRRSGRSWNAVCVPESDDADPGLVELVRGHVDEFRWLPAVPLYDPRLYLALGRALADFRVQVVHSHLSTANIASRAVAVPLRRPHMATIHTVPGPTAEDSRLRAYADGWSSWFSRRLVAPSAEVADAYRAAFRLPRDQMRVIPNVPAAQPPPNGFDREALRREVAGQDVEHFVLAVARLQPEKGIDDLVTAAASLRARLPGLRVAVAGSGPEEGALRAHIERAGLAGSFTLLGSRSDVGSLLASADAFCLPSRHEGLPISLLEAMQAGIACVATRVGGVPGVIADGLEGILVEPADPNALAVALERLLTDRDAAGAMGARAQALAYERYDVAAATAAYADVYDELVDSPRSEEAETPGAPL
jgi:glycosyltransferase involved in cell wall biosynthesis